MEAAVFLDHLRREIVDFTARLDGDLDAEVPTCPAWTVATLVGHVGQVHRFALQQLHAEPGADLVLERGPAPTEHATLLAWFAEGAERLVESLAATDPAEHRPNWAGAPTSHFWFRRMAHEMAVHRVDLETAFGDARPVDAELAVDGVNEFAEVFLGRVDPARLGGDRTVHLHATDDDVEGEWVLTLGDEVISCVQAHEKSDVAARGPASDLLLALWNRRSADDLEVFGDRALLDDFLAALAGM